MRANNTEIQKYYLHASSGSAIDTTRYWVLEHAVCMSADMCSMPPRIESTNQSVQKLDPCTTINTFKLQKWPDQATFSI